jgi:inhibitor of KinA
MSPHMKWSPLGERAVLVWCDDESAALALAQAARAQSWPWLIDVVQAYASVAVYFDREPNDPNPTTIVEFLESLAKWIPAPIASRRHAIPVCYEKALDLGRMAALTGLDRDVIIRLHASPIYTVYAIGFCPGFPYLGYLPDALAIVPRLPTPRVRVAAGSVGLTGRQTGIYTEARPGGWNIVGQTPLELVNVADGYFPLRTGDEVRFERIDERVFEKLTGERLPCPSLPADERIVKT